MIDRIKVCIQIEAGSFDRRIYNEKTLEYKGTHRTSRPFPYPYGFILETNAADGDNVDCYIITREKLKSGNIVECEPIGLLEQYENEEVDHKVLATMPGEYVVVSQSLHQELKDFICALCSQFPNLTMRVGPILSQTAAIDYIQASRFVCS
jgi:inorganic pyrophosphatase